MTFDGEAFAKEKRLSVDIVADRLSVLRAVEGGVSDVHVSDEVNSFLQRDHECATVDETRHTPSFNYRSVSGSASTSTWLDCLPSVDSLNAAKIKID